VSQGAAESDPAVGKDRSLPLWAAEVGENGPVMKRRDARVALGILTVINFLNYIDRYVLASVFEPMKHELHFTDTQLGLISSAFMIAYSFTSPVFGRLGDLYVRKYLIATGVALWSFATAGAGLARNFLQMFLPRSLVGIGEASYATIAPGIITDFYEEKRRGRALAIFYAAIPVGTALGYILGGELSTRYGWRMAFFLVGLPGLLFSLLTLMIREPKRGATDAASGASDVPAPSLSATYKMLVRNRTYVAVTLGFVAYTFALGGLAVWAPSFLMRERGLSTSNANNIFGGMTVVSGFLGTFAGGYLGDYLLRYTKHSYLWISGLCMFAGAPAAAVGLTVHNPYVFLPAIFVAEFFLFLNTGPLNAVVLGCVSAQIRATAMAVNIFFIHMLGDAISPTIIGAVSDRVGLGPGVMITPAMMLASGVVLLSAIKTASNTGAGDWGSGIGGQNRE
jgi:MFS transporter, Spinster family, sphingosine-1-phosphate transporter